MYTPAEIDHRLMFNPMTLELKVINNSSSQLKFRGSTWSEIHCGTKTECENIMDKINEGLDKNRT